jgi:hypothetical protein
MSEFTYTVFLVVASIAGALVSLFVGVIALALALDTSTVPGARSAAPTDSHDEYQRAA